MDDKCQNCQAPLCPELREEELRERTWTVHEEICQKYINGVTRLQAIIRRDVKNNPDSKLWGRAISYSILKSDKLSRQTHQYLTDDILQVAKRAIFPRPQSQYRTAVIGHRSPVQREKHWCEFMGIIKDCFNINL